MTDAKNKKLLVAAVLGRRGLSRVQQFFAGRVSTKVLQIGQKHHVWIVN